jgi:hypothetical protein
MPSRRSNNEPWLAGQTQTVSQRSQFQMSLCFSTVVVFLLVLGGCATFTSPRKPMPITEVVKLSKSGAESPLVIQRIRDSRTTYALRGSDFSKLKANGVPDPVLDYLQQSFVDDLDLSTRYWVTGEGVGGCAFCYPQPVDVDTLESGYEEVAATPPGQYRPDKPQGTPAWVPYPSKVPSAGQISVSDIEQMAKDGVSDAQIIERINHSRLTQVIGVGGTFVIRTQPVAGLSGSELAGLYGQSVDYPVLDALQGQFLAQFIEVERLRYMNLGKAPMKK